MFQNHVRLEVTTALCKLSQYSGQRQPHPAAEGEHKGPGVLLPRHVGAAPFPVYNVHSHACILEGPFCNRDLMPCSCALLSHNIIWTIAA